MTLNGEILKALYDTLKEVKVPIFTFPSGLEISFEFEDDHAKELAKKLFEQISPYLPTK